MLPHQVRIVDVGPNVTIPAGADARLEKLCAAFGERFGKGNTNPKVVGHWMGKNVDRKAAGYRLEREEDRHEELPRWRVVRLAAVK